MKRAHPELVGTCQRCKTERTIVRGRKGARIIEHDEPRRGSGMGQPRRCGGSGMRSVEDCAPDREKARAARADAVDRVRGEAAVLLDALLTGHEILLRDKAAHEEKIAHYRKLAFEQYRQIHPKSQPDCGGVKWKGREDRHGRREGTLVDLYCVFCGELIATHPKPWWKRASEPEVWNPVQQHVTLCALQCLIGLRKPVPPGTCNAPTTQVTIAEVVPAGDGPLFGARP